MSKSLIWHMNFLLLIAVLFGCLLPSLDQLEAEEQQASAAERVKAAIDYWRDTSSYAEASMTIHRPDWQREMSMRSWTKGTEKTLVRFTAPAKDAGNATLKLEDQMWSYSPKISKVIKIPPSMMGQSWMGSDFSYNDLAKADDIVKNYDHKFIGIETHEGQKVDVIESIPKESAPVVWGREVLKVRADNLMLEHYFYDQDMKLVKTLRAREIVPMGGKLFARIIRMEQAEKPQEWTEMVHHQIQFSLQISDSAFTLSNLSNPRQ